MHLRYRIARSLAVICCLAFVVAPALAAKPAPNEVKQFTLQLPAAPAATCQLGVLGPPFNAFGYVLPPNDAYYTLLDPASCGCLGNLAKATTGHISLFWTEPCSISGTYSIVPAILASPGCYVPNVNAPPICGPLPFTAADGGVINDCVDFQMPFPATGCCFSEPVFFKVEFDGGTCQPNRPAFCGPSSCTNCKQYNTYPGSPFFGDDLCATLSGFGIFGIVMFADTDCGTALNCGVVPALPHTWGTVKMLYR